MNRRPESGHAHYRSIVEERRLRLQALEADLLAYCEKDPWPIKRCPPH